MKDSSICLTSHAVADMLHRWANMTPPTVDDMLVCWSTLDWLLVLVPLPAYCGLPILRTISLLDVIRTAYFSGGAVRIDLAFRLYFTYACGEAARCTAA